MRKREREREKERERKRERERERTKIAGKNQIKQQIGHVWTCFSTTKMEAARMEACKKRRRMRDGGWR